MSEIKSGGPAFPIPGGEFIGEDRTTGMSLRDYFAAQAIVGLVTRMNAETVKKYFTGRQDGREALIAYVIADAMLVARKLEGSE